jgi:hypothetical protein
VLREVYEGFLVPTDRLHKLGGDTLKELREEALKGDVHAAAWLAVNAEMERLARIAEAGFPDAPRILDRLVDALGEHGHSLDFDIFVEEFPRRRLESGRRWGSGYCTATDSWSSCGGPTWFRRS